MNVSPSHLAAALEEETAASLGGQCGAPSCAALCRRVNGALEDELERARADGVAVACAPGCSFCCHQRVSVLPHEAVALLNHLQTRMPERERADIERRIVDNARRVDGMSVAEHLAANLACAFLREGRCAAYEVRPSVCAGFHSLSKERCEHSYNHPHDIGTPRNSRPALLEVAALGEALAAAMVAGCSRAGKDSGKRELHQALRALLEEPAARERWCAGGVLAGAR